MLHNADGTTTVTDLTVVDIISPERVESLLAEAMDKRSVGCTALNEQSSRSHMVFTLKLDGFNTVTEKKVAGVLNLIDLAGSERVKDSGASGQRLKEAQAINTSLSALGERWAGAIRGERKGQDVKEAQAMITSLSALDEWVLETIEKGEDKAGCPGGVGHRHRPACAG